MADENTENLDSKNETEDSNSEDEGENIDSLKKENAALEEKNKQLFARAKKAEGFELKDGDWIKPSVEEKPSDKSDKLGFSEMAYLKSSGIAESEFTFVEDELDKFNGKLNDLIGNEYFKASLEKMRKEKNVEDATPTGSKRSHSSAKDTVEYWKAKGELPPMTPENRELRQKVVNSRIETEKNVNKYSDSPLIKG